MPHNLITNLITPCTELWGYVILINFQFFSYLLSNENRISFENMILADVLQIAEMGQNIWIIGSLP